jgi:hypothetical protein
MEAREGEHLVVAPYSAFLEILARLIAACQHPTGLAPTRKPPASSQVHCFLLTFVYQPFFAPKPDFGKTLHTTLYYSAHHCCHVRTPMRVRSVPPLERDRA